MLFKISACVLSEASRSDSRLVHCGFGYAEARA